LVKYPIDYSDRKPLGSTGEYVVAIGVGTWAIRDYSRAKEALIRAIELGLNMIDTAEMYGSGRAEELIGEVIKAVGRDNVFVTTKLYPHRFTDRYTAIKAARASLRRLGIDCVDLILIHWPNPNVPISKQVRALEAIADEGLSRYVGVSNFSSDELIEAIESTSKYDIVVNQVKYSVLDKRIEDDLLPTCIRYRVTIQAYTPIERGRVCDINLIKEIGRRYGKTPVQVALNYLISRPYVTAIPKSERTERIEEFRGALGWRLEPKDIELLEKL